MARKLMHPVSWIVLICICKVRPAHAHGEKGVLVESRQDAFEQVHDKTLSPPTNKWGWRQIVAEPSPPARSKGKMATAKGIAVLFGGVGTSGVLGDTWEYSFVDQMWTEVVASPTPAARSHHDMTLYGESDKVFLYGGGTGFGFTPGSCDNQRFDDIWTYSVSTKQWSQLPKPTFAACHAWKTVMRQGVVTSWKDTILLFSPRVEDHGATCIDDTWLYNVSSQSWTSMASTLADCDGWGYISGYVQMVTVGHTAVAFGSYDHTQVLPCLGGVCAAYEFDLSNPSLGWSPRPVDNPEFISSCNIGVPICRGASGHRQGHGMAGTHATAVLYGAPSGSAAYVNSCDTWEYHVEQKMWIKVATGTQRPKCLIDPEMTASNDDRILLFGGRSQERDEWYEYQRETWEYLPCEKISGLPPHAHYHVGCQWRCDVGFIMVTDGGNRSLCVQDDVHRAWSYSSGNTPSPRVDHSLVNLDDGVVLLFGGRSLDFWSCLNDSWIYSLLGSEGWRQVVSPISPFRRYLSSMSRTTLGRVVLFGGAQLDEECFECSPMAVNDTWVIDQKSFAWKPLDLSRSPSARYGHVMAALDSKVILFGGVETWQDTLNFWDPYYQVTSLNDTWVFDGESWQQAYLDDDIESALVVPPSRALHSMTSAGNCIYMTGGYSFENAYELNPYFQYPTFEDLWVFQLESGWKRLNSTVPANVNIFGVRDSIFTLSPDFVANKTAVGVMENGLDILNLVVEVGSEWWHSPEARTRSGSTLISENQILMFGGQMECSSKEGLPRTCSAHRTWILNTHLLLRDTFDTAGTTTPAPAPDMACAGGAHPFAIAGAAALCVPERLFPAPHVAHCILELTWVQLRGLKPVASSGAVSTGGLGKLLVMDEFEAWLCTTLSSCGGADGSVCFTFSEAREVFVPWGYARELNFTLLW